MRNSVVAFCKGTLILLLPATLGFGARPASGRTSPRADGPVYVAPATIDNTGQTDVTDALNEWIMDDTADGTADTPAVIQLNGTYDLEYGLSIGSRGTDVAHRDLHAYTRNHVILDLTNATLVQHDATPYRVNGEVVQPRRRWGSPLITLYGDTDVEIDGGTLQSTNTLGKYSPQREAWAGVTIGSANNDVRLEGMHVEQVWGDYVYISGLPWPQNVLIDGGVFERNGRQGVTFNNVNGLEIRNAEFLNTERELFDHEPMASGGATNVWIHDNSGDSGGLGYLNLHGGGRTPLHDITVSNNHLTLGHFRVFAAAPKPSTIAENLTITGNVSDTPTAYTGRLPLMTIGALFDNVTVTDNVDHGGPHATALAVNVYDTNVTTTPNEWTGFRQSG